MKYLLSTSPLLSLTADVRMQGCCKLVPAVLMLVMITWRTTLSLLFCPHAFHKLSTSLKMMNSWMMFREHVDFCVCCFYLISQPLSALIAVLEAVVVRWPVYGSSADPRHVVSVCGGHRFNVHKRIAWTHTPDPLIGLCNQDLTSKPARLTSTVFRHSWYNDHSNNIYICKSIPICMYIDT